MSKENLPKATHIGEVDLNGFKMSCAVLEDSTRVFSERSLATAFGIKGGGAYWQKKKTEKGNSAVLPEYLSAKYLKGFITNDLQEKLSSAVSYISPNGTLSKGIDATILADICDVYVTAKNNGVNNGNFLKVANNAYAMIKAFAKVGIIALVDEATKYQYDREKNELQVILKVFISDEILKWQETFQLSFYKEIFRLWNIPFTSQFIKRKPMFIGNLTNKFIYQNLPKGVFVLEKLKEKTPKTKSGNLKYRLHQSLTPDIGREALKKVIYSVEALASISENKRMFLRLMADKYGQKEIPFTEVEEAKDPVYKETELSIFNKNLKKALDYTPKK